MPQKNFAQSHKLHSKVTNDLRVTKCNFPVKPKNVTVVEFYFEKKCKICQTRFRWLNDQYNSVVIFQEFELGQG